MAKSDYVMIKGEGMTIGAHGETDYGFVSGEPISNFGGDTFVLKSGVAIGRGSFAFEAYPGANTATLTDGSTPAYLSHDGTGSTTASDNFPGVNRTATLSADLGSYPWAVEFNNLEFSNNATLENEGANNNIAVGLSVESSPRYFEGDSGACIYYQKSEAKIGGGSGDFPDTDFFAWNDPNASDGRAGKNFPAIDWGTGITHDFRIEFDGTEARLYIDGEDTPTATIFPDYTETQFNNMRSAFTLEDDGDTDVGEEAELKDYNEQQL